MKRLLAIAAAALALAMPAVPAQAHGGFWPGFAAGAALSFFRPPVFYAPPLDYGYLPPVAWYPPGAPTVLVPAPLQPDPAIRWAQHGLNVLMGAGLNEDGIEGPATYAAFCEFQRRNGLVVDGILGTAMGAVIENQLAHLAPPPVAGGTK